MEQLISIIMPAYNAKKYISDSIKSVLNQTYSNWELIVIDDCSTDDTSIIIKEYCKRDYRIKYIKQSKNSGAACARNKGIKEANGTYIAFLDSDDLWYSNKLELQVSFMKREDILFSCTYYDKIDENGKAINKIIRYKSQGDYKELLKNCPGNSTVMYNAEKLGKIYAKNIKRRNDYVLWLDVIKQCKKIYCLNEVLGSHRIVNNSLSSNKSKLIKYHWYIYRDIEHLNIFICFYLILYWSLKGIRNKVIIERRK